jgi:hypothetical protein
LALGRQMSKSWPMVHCCEDPGGILSCRVADRHRERAVAWRNDADMQRPTVIEHNVVAAPAGARTALG